MFGIGTSELIIILIIAFLVVGPKDLPKVGKEIGKAFRSFQRAKADLTDSITRDVADINRDKGSGSDEEKRG
ncbi:MAG: twin-arginine translocase TatA/TatE family subunit [Nitrospirae bacterium]|nr:twin-arginine translocase TatA/TatE family subunit [Nitrospirota bacterium]